MEAWLEFWAAYPKKVAKLGAERAYNAARKRASHQDIMDGLWRYIEHKPSWCEFAHASSWLRAGRWEDEIPGHAVTRRCSGGHTPPCETGRECTKRIINEARAAEGRPLL